MTDTYLPHKVPSSIPPHPSVYLNKAHHLFEVQPIPLKELGAIATRKIKKGELVIEESPLFVFDAPLAAFLFSRQVDVDPSVEEKAKGYSALDRAIGRAITELMAPHQESDKQIMLELANTHPELPPAYAVFKTNAVSTTLATGGLFPLLSRVNSSCRPNLTRPLWDREAKVTRCWAGRDIEEGEELGWMYLDSYYRTIAERKAETLDVLGFECACPGCALTSPLAELSDDRVAQLGSLFSQLHIVATRQPTQNTLSRSSDPPPEDSSLTAAELEKDLAILDEMIPLAQAEGLFDLERTLGELREKRWKAWLGPRGMGRRPGKNCCECCY